MGKFRITLTDQAKIDIQKHYLSGNQSAINKIEKILKELSEHPYIGTGQPEQLKYNLQGFWSRRINKKDRMIYSVNDTIVVVEVVSAMGHYKDK
jgi:toxin YoeB